MEQSSKCSFIFLGSGMRRGSFQQGAGGDFYFLPGRLFIFQEYCDMGA